MINYVFVGHSYGVSYMGEVGPWQFAIVIVALVLIFGGKKIPELMKGLGQGIKHFKDGMNGQDEESKKDNIGK